MMKRVYVVLAVVLLAGSAWTGLPAAQASRARTNSCERDLGARSRGGWVKLVGCAVDQFHNAMLRDEGGQQTHLVLALRKAGQPASTPAVVGLAARPALLVDGTHRQTIRPDSTQTADLGECLGVVLGGAGDLGHELATFPGIDSGLGADAVFVELRHAPSARLALVLFAAAVLAGGLAFAPKRAQRAPELQRARVAAPAAPGHGPTSALRIRWGLVFVSVLVGVVALARGLQWYFDALRTSESPSPMTRPAPPLARVTVLVPPTPDELAGLTSDDPELQRIAIERMGEREVTPDVVRAVDLALARVPRSKELEAGLVCLRARSEGTDSLPFLLARFPSQPLEVRDSRCPGVVCVAAALAERIAQDPATIKEALERALFSENEEVIRQALRGFRLLAPAPIPPELGAEALREFSPHRRAALRAVVALGGTAQEPGLVLEAARIDSSDHVIPIDDELAEDPHSNTARIVARLCVERPDGQFGRLAARREGIHHDVSAALLEIVSDPLERVPERASALRILQGLGETGPLPGLRQLRMASPIPVLTPRVQETIAALEALERQDRPPLMHELPPRAGRW
jgi:hypothetical protein